MLALPWANPGALPNGLLVHQIGRADPAAFFAANPEYIFLRTADDVKIVLAAFASDQKLVSIPVLRHDELSAAVYLR